MKEEKKTVPIITDPALFPADPACPDGAFEMDFADPELPSIHYIPDVVYAEKNGMKLHLQILLPTGLQEKKLPLIVRVPGSAWHKQYVYDVIDQMTEFCRKGFAVAIVEYRPSELAPFPAQTEDCKTAIRFMRMHAEEYQIDPERIGLFGDSSGGHTVLLSGITSGDILSDGTYADYSDDVSCIVDWYGPTDISLMNCYPSGMDHVGADSPEGYLIGRKNVLDNPEEAEKTVVMNYITAETKLPPILIMHGDRDMLVPFNQSCLLYEKLKACGQEAVFYKLKDADHGTKGFRSPEVLELMIWWLKKYLA